MTAGRTLAGYRLQERIAVGGMAELFRATRVGPAGFAKQVVVKTVLPDLCEDPQFVEMFLEEARLAARLSSPNLVQVFDAGHEEGAYFLVMEYVDGPDLAALLARRGRLPAPLCVHLGRQLCAALADLHEATDERGGRLNVVHRDVNPGNVLLSRQGDVKLGDFGIAKSAARGLRTDRGTVKGKLAYLSPEQARGEEVDGRADLYGLGLILFEALTGQRYLTATGEVELLRQAEEPPLRAPSEQVPSLPAALDDVLARALAVDPARRYPDARLLDKALARVEPELEQEKQAATTPREQLAALVREPSPCWQGGVVSGRATTREDDEPASLKPAARRRGLSGEPPTGPSTEVMHAAETRRLAAWRVVLVGLFGGAAAVLVLVLTLTPRSDPSDAGPDTVAQVDDAIAVPDARPQTDARFDRDQQARNQVDSRAVVPRRRRSKRSPDVRLRLKPRPPVDAGAPDSAGRPARRVSPSRLAAIDRLLEQRGLLREDLPKIAARRRELGAAAARGEEVSGELDRLEARIRSFAIDRTFVERKLRRLTREMAGRTLQAGVKQRIQRHAQRALSHAVTGRYADANRELNRIASLLLR